MKRQLLLLSLMAMAMFSCDKNEDEDPATACGVSDPVENLPWLKQMSEEAASDEFTQYSYIAQAIYNGETVFYNGSCCPNCNWQLTLYDCSGNAIENDYSISDLENNTVIWHPENSVCEFN